ncbi:anti-sigma factor domain-containing protein [Gottfriedia sp. NPDC057991]|uniref:anti-sigma factor domain-containing protein n=1 Tax=Gottfriedia sp. NPDC057991 TaxID=3346298 RepID=UPI0036DC1A2B
MNNGIVLKVNRSSVVVLTANGEYLKCKKLLSSYSIGEEIQFPSNAIILNNNKMKISIPKMIPVVIACGLILFSFTFINLNKEEALAAGRVTIDSEAKLSLILDKQLNVIDLKAHNEQGKKVINNMENWKQEPLNLVMDDLVGEMKKSKVIEPDEKIKLTGEMRKKFENKQSELNHELKDIQDSNNHINIPNSEELDQPKVKTQNHSQNQNKPEKSFNSNSTKVTKGETNNNKSSSKSPTIEKEKNNDNGHSKEVQNNRHQDEHWGNKQRQWNHRNQNEHHESSNQNQKKQYNNYEKHQDKKKNDYNDDRELRRSNNDQGRNENKEGCHGCNNRYKNDQNENKNNNGWQNGNEKHSD